ncbi:unnamed protein product, partial [Pleuronectes platessa]
CREDKRSHGLSGLNGREWEWKWPEQRCAFKGRPSNLGREKNLSKTRGVWNLCLDDCRLQLYLRRTVGRFDQPLAWVGNEEIPASFFLGLAPEHVQVFFVFKVHVAMAPAVISSDTDLKPRDSNTEGSTNIWTRPDASI